MHAALAAFPVTDACHRTVTNVSSQTAKTQIKLAAFKHMAAEN